MGRDRINLVSRTDIDQYQLFMLRRVLSYVYQKSVFYREIFNQRGIKPGGIKSLADIANIPFTNPSDLAAFPYKFACVSLGNMERITTFTSSGTTGPQKRVFFTQKDLETMTDFMSAGMRTVAKKGDVVQIMLPSTRPNDQADLLAKGVTKMGGIPVITGTTPKPDDQIKAISENRPQVLFAGVSRMFRITMEARHKHDLMKGGVRVLFVTSEYLAESMRQQLQQIWGCQVRAHYGMTEMGLGVAVECPTQDGFHFNEADLLLEVIDPETGVVLPDGKEGELVFTTLSMEGTPLIRYRTHDISILSTPPCGCGASSLKKIAKVNRRLETIVKVGQGDEIYPALFDELIFGIPDIVDYQLNLRKKGNKDVLHFKIEANKGNDDLRNMITEKVLDHPLARKNISGGFMLLPEIEVVDPGALVRMTRAKKLIIDERVQS